MGRLTLLSIIEQVEKKHKLTVFHEDEQTVLFNAFAMDAKPDKTDHHSRGWHLYKMQRLKRQDLRQKTNYSKKYTPGY